MQVPLLLLTIIVLTAGSSTTAYAQKLITPAQVIDLNPPQPLSNGKELVNILNSCPDGIVVYRDTTNEIKTICITEDGVDDKVDNSENQTLDINIDVKEND